MITQKLLRHALCSIAVVIVAGGCDFDMFGPGYGDGMGCGSSCVVQPFVTPYSANILKGDTVRFVACDDYNKCGYNKADTGTVLTRWTLSDSGVAALTNGTSAILVPSATSAIARGVATGTTSLTPVFSKGGNQFVPKMMIRVADSTAINSIELPMYGYSDSLRVNTVRPIGVYLRDVGGNIFRGAPTGITSSDTTVLKFTKATGYEGGLELRVVGLKAGKASITATFLGLTSTRQFVVVP
jgi:hypothetical protein